MTKVYKLMKQHKDLTLNGYFYHERGRKPYVDTDERLNGDLAQKAYQHIHEYLDLLVDNTRILKSAPIHPGFSYFWKHRVEDYTTLLHQDEFGKLGTPHWIPNGLFIAVLRERGIPEKQIANGPNSTVPFGMKALKFHEKMMGEGLKRKRE